MQGIYIDRGWWAYQLADLANVNCTWAASVFGGVFFQF